MNALKYIRGNAGAAASVAACALALLCLIPGESRAAISLSVRRSAAGTTGADFLNLPIGARAAAMGGAYSAISDEASAVYWNPAGLVQIPKLSAVFMRSQYVADISYQYAAYAHRLSYNSVLAGSVFLTDIGAIDRMDMDGSGTPSVKALDMSCCFSSNAPISQSRCETSGPSLAATYAQASDQMGDPPRAQHSRPMHRTRDFSPPRLQPLLCTFLI